ncbi:MAG: hypothetical protein ACUVQP_11490 [Bacteroidales bacterium]
MKTVLFGLSLLWACNSKNIPSNSVESQPIKDTAKKILTVVELVKDTSTWELLEDSVIIDNVLCDKYRNKKTNQIIIIEYDE